MCGDYNLRREKRYVEVDVRFTPDGKIRPLAINYDKAHTYGIDRVLAVKHGTSRLGGKGHCFTCLICGQKPVSYTHLMCIRDRPYAIRQE